MDLNNKLKLRSWAGLFNVTVSPYLTALTLECYACSSHPQFFGGSSCNSDNVAKITCPMFFDRCFTMKAMVSIGVGVPPISAL